MIFGKWNPKKIFTSTAHLQAAVATLPWEIQSHFSTILLISCIHFWDTMYSHTGRFFCHPPSVFLLYFFRKTFVDSDTSFFIGLDALSVTQPQQRSFLHSPPDFWQKRHYSLHLGSLMSPSSTMHRGKVHTTETLPRVCFLRQQNGSKEPSLSQTMSTILWSNCIDQIFTINFHIKIAHCISFMVSFCCHFWDARCQFVHNK